MAILNLLIENDKMKIFISMHEGEKKTDSTYKWAKYALDLSTQLNFNETTQNVFTVDQGCYIHFLSNDIIVNNSINSYGYIVDSNEFNDDYYEEDYDFDSDFHNRVDNGVFEVRDESSLRSEIYNNNDSVGIILDQHDAVQVVGGLLTLTAKSGTAIHEALKETSKKLYKLKSN